MNHTARRHLTVGTLLFLTACGGAGEVEGDLWILLASGPVLEFRPAAARETGGLTLAPDPNSGGLRTSVEVRRSDWREDKAGLWSTQALLVPVGVPAEGTALTLDVGGRLLYLAPFPPQPGFFAVRAGRALLALPPGEEPPARATLCAFVDLGGPKGGGLRARLSSITADGVSLGPGGFLRTSSRVPPLSALRFATVAQQVARGGNVELRFRIALDGKTLFEHTQTPANPESVVRHEILLPSGGTLDGEFLFEVDGDPAVGAFLTPVIGPVQASAAERPDLILFLADTFRADNLTAYGGEHGLAENLDAFAERSLRFTEARAPSTWTLPSHASLFTALYPGQHGAYGGERNVPDELVTLAEHLMGFGYRTGAITDSIYVSERFGIDQGFSWFQEHEEWDLDATLSAADAFLAAGDGRPTFLFVHTYETHAPYRASEQTAAMLELRRTYEELCAAAVERVLDGHVPGERVRWPLELVDELRTLYLGNVVDLDRKLGAWLDELEAGGVLARSNLVFTSDHGEAFLEHGHLFHGGKPFEELVRVPLLIHGPGLGRGEVSHPASLVDLPRTLSELAGVPPHPSWDGRSLLSLDADRPSYAFFHAKDFWSMAIVDGDRKVFANGKPDDLRAGSYELAFDLGRDPGESEPVSSDWPAGICRAHASRVSELLELIVRPESVRLSARDRERLQAVGYVGY